MRNRVIKSGNDVPIAKMAGRMTPYDTDIVAGINVTKNKTNIVGQNPRVKLTPIRKAPKLPFFINFSGIDPKTKDL